VTQSFCEVGSWVEGATCSQETCATCGDGCIEFGETCDDGDTASGDGCSSTCHEETCFTCNESLGDVAPQGENFIPFCAGPSQCRNTGVCDVCGDEVVGPTEQCDDGNTANGDCCSSTCQFESSQSPCTDHVFCNGPEKCNGAGSCLNQEQDVDCSSLDSQCAIGVCDEEAQACVADGGKLDGAGCTDTSGCVVAGTGVCADGACVGLGTTLSPTCRWIIVAGNSGSPVRVQNGPGSLADASICGDSGRASGATTGNYVVTANAGTGIKFGKAAEVAGDIVTDGAAVSSSLYGTVPGTVVKTVAGATTMAKTPSGSVDTSGSHLLVDVCNDDQAALAIAATTLNAKPNTVPALPTIKVPVGAQQIIDGTGDGVTVVETPSLRVAHHGKLSLVGGPTDVIMIRVLSGRLSLGYGAKVLLSGGLKPENVLFYSKWKVCRLAPGVTGFGTVFCPDAGKYVIGSGVEWQGTFLGGSKEIRAKKRSDLTHVPFLGF
jgi:cysteine-rich repeat protein